MNSQHDSVERHLESLAPPLSPPVLRARVLASARAALAKPPSRDRWSTLRWNRPLRLAWAAAVALLALGHLLIPRGSLPRVAERGQRSEPLPLARSIGNPGEELAEIVALPRIDPAARSLAELLPREATEPVQRSPAEALPPEEKGSAS